MVVLFLALVILVAAGLLALVTSRLPRLCTTLGVAGAVAGCLLGLVPAVRVLWNGKTQELRLDWNAPYGSLATAIDPLSAFFLVPILLVCALAALYGGPYLLAHRQHKSLGIPWFFFNLLAASMVLVVVAKNGVLFLMAWEIMALASFFLVTFEDEREEVRAAGKTYLIASHLGTAFLLMFFVVLGHGVKTLDFDRFTAVSPATANVLFLLALVGFGTKAGFMPFHVWLPEAHPAAPSHVSAVMSGVMIKTGIYGLVRAFTFLPTPPAWWGHVLIGVGILSGVWGILFALAQHDLKRFLAYSTVENVGIIALGLGLGLLGWSMGNWPLAVLGFTGALLHALNHALFKSLLFLGAGAVLFTTGTRDINHLGGLSKRMPWLAIAFLTGAAAICGLPPFNGFAGEFLIYVGAFAGARSASTAELPSMVAVIAALALIGGLAVIGLTKVFGVFLGEPRTKEAASARSPGPLMTGPMLVLAAACLLLGLMAPRIVTIMMPVVAQVIHQKTEQAVSFGGTAMETLSWVVVGASVLLALIGALAVVRRVLLSRQQVDNSVTWGCGYAQPTPRMQYTASSFVQPVLDFFAPFLHTRKKVTAPEGWFPTRGSIDTQTDDLPKEFLYRPLFDSIGWLLSKLRWLQHGYAHLYILYVGVTLVALLVWFASRI